MTARPGPEELHSREYVSLRDYIDHRFEAADRALVLATQQMDKRLDGMNEFRQSLRDQAATFVPRAEWDSKHVELERRVAVVERLVASIQTTVSTIRTLVGIVGVPGIAAFIWTASAAASGPGGLIR